MMYACSLPLWLTTPFPLSSSFDELCPAIEAMKNQNSFAQFINSKDNASSLDKCWRKLDGIINDTGVSSLVFLSPT